MDTIKNAGNYVSDKIQGTSHEASKEANKNVAKDSNVGVTDRLSAAGDAISDKAKESKHDASAESHKQQAMH
ncbi:glucose-repressible protein Grg1 [Echria macrotheca]|uniref:Glucose-repressible protein Grg1 n=1 Tax=Echria macrotheca TaxID=438768 RepID=A0AAJ0BBI3_9PEZI|nr:glucose-repressible protein Grg1 [Echria macrotheca]